jgi:two-component system, sensor histidine kinase
LRLKWKSLATRGGQPAGVRAESMRLLLKQIPAALAVNVTNATLMALVLARVQSFLPLALWVAMLAVVSARLLLWWRLSHRDPPLPERLELWEKRALLGSIVSGTLWGAGAFLLFPEHDFYQVFVAFVLGGMAAGAAAGLSYSLPIYFGFLLPSVIPLAARFFLEGTPGHTVMGAMVLIFALALSLFARNQHAALTTALTLQFDKGRLAAELTDLLQNLEQRVQERTNELRLANAQMGVEIAERQRAEEAERQARSEAEQANAAKSVFLAAASHDLRQPFQGLRLYLDVLNRELTTEKQRDVAKRISATLDAGQALLDTLMDLSALETGKIEPAIQEFRPQDLIDHVAEEFRITAQQKGLLLRVHACPTEPVTTDPVLFSRVLRNLITNALRHTTKGKVLIACRKRKDHVRVEVWDTGAGIPEDRLKDIFEAFYQINRREQVLGKGLGLGLWIVARMAQLLHYRIEVKSRLGRGSVFSINIPLRAALTRAP